MAKKKDEKPEIKNEESSKVKELKEKLFMKRVNSTLSVEDDEIEKADEFCVGYKKFLDNAKIEREAVKTSVELAKKAGFTEYDPSRKYKAGDKVYVINRGKAVMLAVIGKRGCKDGVKLSIAHIDSPRLDLKPNPLYESNNLAMFKTHYYGGIKKYQWTAIPLALHGAIALKDGTVVDVCFGEDESEPCLCVTDLLPHLAGEQMSKSMNKAFTGEDLNVLIGSRPFKDDSESELVKLNILNILNKKYGITEGDFLSADLEVVPAYKARDIGFDASLIGGYGHDDRVCAYPALKAILDCKSTPKNTVITVLTDKEEIGSDGNTGMCSDYMRFFIEDLAQAEGLELRHVLSKSKCLSADVNAAFDPNYAGVYEANNSCYINGGVVITKYTGHGGKYGTSDACAEYMAEIRSLLDDDDILWQAGELGKVDIGGGGTIAKFVANMNVDVVDLGIPVLSMHAPFEIISKIDIYMAYRAFKSFFEA